MTEQTILVPVEQISKLLQRTFELIGSSSKEAERIAKRLIGANLRGHESHGVIRMPRYVDYVLEGVIVPNQKIKILKENEVISIVDGQYGFGQTVGEQVIRMGVEKAVKNGTAVTALRNAGHLGRIGDLAELAAEENVASLHMVNVRGSLLVAPFGGVERRGSTSPFCCGIPVPGRPPVIHDFATSLVAEGKALVALQGGKPLPEGSIIETNGRLSNNPVPLYGEITKKRYPDPNQGPGALTGFGLHKGSGLNFFMEMFAGALGGSGTAGGIRDTSPRRLCNGMLSVYFSVDFFHGDDWFAREVQDYIEYFKSARPAEPGGDVLIPGELELMLMKERMQTGFPVSAETLKDLIYYSEKVGVEEPIIKILRDIGY